MRSKLVVLAWALFLAAWGSEAMAAAEVRRFNVVFSAIPTQIKGGDYNDLVGLVNDQLEAAGLEPLEPINHTWLLEAEGRYFVRSNFAVMIGAGRIRKTVKQEYLPSVNQSIIISSNITSVPIHAGAAYYLKPYNQGDFQARAYVSAGVMSVVHNRASVRIQTVGVTLPPEAAVGFSGTNDAPGYFIEAGTHMFFASRFSVMLGVLYRSNVIETMINEDNGQPIYNIDGTPASFDPGGVGFRMALGIGI